MGVLCSTQVRHHSLDPLLEPFGFRQTSAWNSIVCRKGHKVTSPTILMRSASPSYELTDRLDAGFAGTFRPPQGDPISCSAASSQSGTAASTSSAKRVSDSCQPRQQASAGMTSGMPSCTIDNSVPTTTGRRVIVVRISPGRLAKQNRSRV